MTTDAQTLARADVPTGARRSLTALASSLVDSGRVPDALVRAGIRHVCRARLRSERAPDAESQARRLAEHVAELRRSPIAIETAAANRQHYEVPAAFFERVLGPHMKYSAGYWPDGVTTLAQSERAMLELTCERAQIASGQQILELGCGWGSLTLFMAERYPFSRILGVSNSRSQREFILARARERGLQNVEILTADINEFATARRFDRIVSVEMFEHLRNYEALLARVSGWLHQAGLLFVHIFTHQRFAYPYLVRDASDWMAEHFFTGGQMPSDDLLLYFQQDLRIVEHWRLPGTHYEKTSNAWLANMDAHRGELMTVFERTYGRSAAPLWWVRWRVFFMACAELFGFRRGEEWLVSHYLFRK
jgi:cyclopropane-fatty-acyl-phospholipid synthase